MQHHERDGADTAPRTPAAHEALDIRLAEIGDRDALGGKAVPDESRATAEQQQCRGADDDGADRLLPRTVAWHHRPPGSSRTKSRRAAAMPATPPAALFQARLGKSAAAAAPGWIGAKSASDGAFSTISSSSISAVSRSSSTPDGSFS